MVGVMAVTGVVLDDAGYGQAAIAALMSAHFVGMFAFSIPLGGLADRRGRRASLAGGAVVTAVGALGTGLIGESIAITPFFFLLGLGWCACFVASTSVLADVTTRDRARPPDGAQRPGRGPRRGRRGARAAGPCSASSASGPWAA